MSKISRELDEKKVIEAGYRLGKWLIEKQESICRLLNIRPAVVEDAPASFSALYKAFTDALLQGSSLERGFLPVSSENQQWTIFGELRANSAFRFWHDIMHCTYGLQFTLKDELLLGHMHVEEVKTAFGHDSLEARIMEADTVGQTMYESMHGKFPKQQRDFALAFILDGTSFALTQWKDVL